MRRTLLLVPAALALALPSAAGALGAAGDLDPTFNGGAVAFVRPDPATAKAIALDDVVSDTRGRLVAAGNATPPDGSGSALAVARLLPTGAVDTGFATAGQLIRQVSQGGAGQNFSSAVGVTTTAAGGVLVGASRYQGGVGHHGAFSLTGGGDPEVEYGTGGLATTTNVTPKGLTAFGAAFAPDGSSYAMGWFTSSVPDAASGSFSLTKFTAAGDPDPAFGTGGTVIGDASTTPAKPSSTLYAGLATADGKLLLGGSAWTGGQFASFVTRRDARTGAIDPTFGTTAAGVTRFDPRAPGFGANTGFGVRDLAVAGDRIYAVTGTYDATGAPEVLVARMTADGALDTAWADGGFKKLQVGATRDGSAGTAIAVQPDGRVVVTASTNVAAATDDAVVLRLMPDGSLDRSFGRDGLVRLRPVPGAYNVTSDVALSGDRLVVLGRSGDGTSWVTRLLQAPLPDRGASPVPDGVAKTAPAVKRGTASVRTRRFRLDRRGRVSVVVRCPKTGACAGGVGFVAASGRLPAKAAARAARYGKRSYGLKAGTTRTVKVALYRAARRTVARKRSLRARLVLRRTGAKTTTAKVTLLPRRR